jgi:adenylate cyclase
MNTPSGALSDSGSRQKSFLANLRHELRTPLNAIIGYSEMLLEDAAEDRTEFQSRVRQIRRNGAALLSLVNTNLDASKIADGEARKHGRELCWQMRGPLEEILADAKVLILNAAGLGITGFVEDLQKIRTAGKRLRAQLRDLHNSTDAADEFSDSGSNLASSDSQETESVLLSSAAAPRRPDAMAGRLLVVDDVALNRDVLSRRLRSEGHQVAVAASGAEALALTRQQPFDMILLDILMPEMGGLEVLRRLKDDPALRHIPVVMISALDEMDSIIRSIETGAEDYLPKPFEPAILRARVGACLEKKRLRDREVEHLKQIEEERNRADGLLHVILPSAIVRELKATNEVKPRRHENVAIMFSDIVGFTPFCDKREPEEIVSHLQQLIVAFEELAIEHDILKIKTIGDSFMAACGLLNPVPNPVFNCLRCGIRMIEEAARLPAKWQVRIGVHCGSVVAGVLGRHQYLFDLWGDTVNTAARMESHGVPAAITLSEDAHRRVADCCRCDSLGVASIKGKGDLKRYVFREFI